MQSANAISIDQHTLYSSGSLHGGGDATVRALLVTSNAASSGCLLLMNADTLRSVLRDETCTSKVICRPPANKECSEGFDAAQHRHRHRDPSRRVQRMTCMAQTHLHPHVSTPRRLSSQTQVAMCERTTSTRHYLSHARFLHRIPHYRAAMAGRNSKTADDDTLYKRRHSVRSCVLFLPGRHAQTVSEASLVFPDKARQCSETLRRTHPPPAITIAGMMKGLP